MKFMLVAVLTVVGGEPKVVNFPTDNCKASMEQIVKSYGLTSYIKSWSVKSMKANNGKMNLVVTCN